MTTIQLHDLGSVASVEAVDVEIIFGAHHFILSLTADALAREHNEKPRRGARG